MFRPIFRGLAALIAILPLASLMACTASGTPKQSPNPALDQPLAATKSQQEVVFAGGCFWGIQAVFEHVKGVSSATAGYSGGEANTAEYETVSSGTTGHAESVKVIFDPSQVTFGQLLKIFFLVAHNPTQLNRQGPDSGTQYRSVIFFTSADQQRIAQAYIDQLNKAGVFSRPIVTQLVPLKTFYAAEAYHQDYAIHHPYEPYIMINDAPKVSHLEQRFPDLYVKK